VQRISGQSPTEGEIDCPQLQGACLYVVCPFNIYERSYSESRVNSSISCDVLIVYALLLLFAYFILSFPFCSSLEKEEISSLEGLEKEAGSGSGSGTRIL
jgi:hypothetical protein